MSDRQGDEMCGRMMWVNVCVDEEDKLLRKNGGSRCRHGFFRPFCCVYVAVADADCKRRWREDSNRQQHVGSKASGARPPRPEAV